MPTHLSSLKAQLATQQGGVQPTNAQPGQVYFDTLANALFIWNGPKNQWMYALYTTTTSTSTSTTSTSSSTTTTSTSTSLTTSTSITTSTSTTTTL